MKIRVKGALPVRPEFCPKVGEVYNVLRIFQNSAKEKVFYVMVKGATIGIWQKDCEVIKQ